MKKIIMFILCAWIGLAGGCAEQADIAFEEKSFTADAAQVQVVRIDVRDRKIEVVPGSDGEIFIEYAESGQEGYDIAAEDGKLVMTVKNNKGWRDYIGGKPDEAQRMIRLYVPNGMLQGLELSTTNADITLAALHISQNVSLRANHGDIRFAGLEAGSAVSLETKNGSIQGTLAGGWDNYAISSRVKKGMSNLPEKKEGGEKTLDAAVNHGDIDIAFTG